TAIDNAILACRCTPLVCPRLLLDLLLLVIADGRRSDLEGRKEIKHVLHRRQRGQIRSAQMASSKFQAFWNHPAGPKTIHFWAPTFKWCLNVANVADFVKPPEEISYPQQLALGCSGLIWARYSMVITPKNWNLFSVSSALAVTCTYQISRKIRKDCFSNQDDAVMANTE
ncbi:unnamed protein product, partial [Urochloa humidicola]